MALYVLVGSTFEKIFDWLASVFGLYLPPPKLKVIIIFKLILSLKTPNINTVFM